MNTKIALASFVTALSGLAGFTSTAHAGTDFRINLNLGLPPPPVIVVPGRDHDVRPNGFEYDRRDHGPRGYWKEITVKTWVPARWAITRDRRGREYRTLENGYYTYRTDRVWVDNDRDDRGYAYGRR
jgi:hypothetical protein